MGRITGPCFPPAGARQAAGLRRGRTRDAPVVSSVDPRRLTTQSLRTEPWGLRRRIHISAGLRALKIRLENVRSRTGRQLGPRARVHHWMCGSVRSRKAAGRQTSFRRHYGVYGEACFPVVCPPKRLCDCWKSVLRSGGREVRCWRWRAARSAPDARLACQLSTDARYELWGASLAVRRCRSSRRPCCLRHLLGLVFSRADEFRIRGLRLTRHSVPGL